MNHTDICPQHVAERAQSRFRLFRKVWARLLLWQDVANQRRELQELDTRLLRDIGVGREEARRETRKAFWDCP